VDDPEKLTMERFQVLKLIDDICKQSEFGVAPTQKLIQVLTAERGIKPTSVRVTIMRLARDGYLENPLWGCWRLTEKGKQVLKEVLEEGKENGVSSSR